MNIRTDLAIELEERRVKKFSSTDKKETKKGNIKITEIDVKNEEAEEEIGRKKGKYITIEFPDILKISDYGELEETIRENLLKLLPEKREKILVVGLGNRNITCDNIGPNTAAKLLATRHIAGAFAESIGLKNLKSVAVITPDVLGKTGIEATEICEGVVKKISPDVIIAIDALAAGSVSRLFKTVQITNTGIQPGSGVKNSRKELSFESLSVPVIALGVPTAVDALVLAEEITEVEPKNDCDLIVTPKDCDLLSHRISEILSRSLNLLLQPEIDPEILFDLV